MKKHNISFSQLIRISRPICWFIPPLIMLFSLALLEAKADVFFILELIVASFPISLFVYGINDLYDYKTDKHNKRKRSIIYGFSYNLKKFHRIKSLILTPAIIFLLISLSASIFTGNIYHFVFAFMLVLLIYFYSAPPIRLRSVPIVDSLSNSLMFFFIIALTFALYNRTPFDIPLIVYIICLLPVAAHSFFAVMDYESDKKASLNTIATLLGKRTTLILDLIIVMMCLFFVQTFLLKIIFGIYALFFILLVLFLEKLPKNLVMKIFIILSSMVFFLFGFLLFF